MLSTILQNVMIGTSKPTLTCKWHCGMRNMPWVSASPCKYTNWSKPTQENESWAEFSQDFADTAANGTRLWNIGHAPIIFYWLTTTQSMEICPFFRRGCTLIQPIQAHFGNKHLNPSLKPKRISYVSQIVAFATTTISVCQREISENGTSVRAYRHWHSASSKPFPKYPRRFVHSLRLQIPGEPIVASHVAIWLLSTQHATSLQLHESLFWWEQPKAEST